jgi:hypothetical protein
MQLDKATGAKCFTLSSSALQPPAYSTLVPVGSDFDYSKRGKRSEIKLASTRAVSIFFFSTANLLN